MWQRFAAQRSPLTGGFGDQLLRIGLADEVDGAMLPRRAAVLLFADEPGSLLAAFDSRADIRVRVYDGKHAVPGATPNLRKPASRRYLSSEVLSLLASPAFGRRPPIQTQFGQDLLDDRSREDRRGRHQLVWKRPTTNDP